MDYFYFFQRFYVEPHHLGTGFTGASYDEVVEFEDSATEEEINEAYEDWKNNYLDASWWEE